MKYLVGYLLVALATLIQARVRGLGFSLRTYDGFMITVGASLLWPIAVVCELVRFRRLRRPR